MDTNAFYGKNQAEERMGTKKYIMIFSIIFSSTWYELWHIIDKFKLKLTKVEKTAYADALKIKLLQADIDYTNDILMKRNKLLQEQLEELIKKC